MTQLDTSTFRRIALAGVAVLLFSLPSLAQAPLRAQGRIAYESGRGSVAISSPFGDKIYVLNREDRCVWVFDRAGTSLGHVSSAGMGPADLLSPKSLAVDSRGSIYVADRAGSIKVFEPGGTLSLSFAFKTPEDVAVLSDGRILVSGFPRESLFEVFDRSGKKLAEIGQPFKEMEDNAHFNAVLNMGRLVVDDSDNIYYIFRFRPLPTIRKYRPNGDLVAEWNLKSPHFAELLPKVRATIQESKARGSSRVTGVLAGGAFDRESRRLWVGSGNVVLGIDTESGETIRSRKLYTSDVLPLQVEGLQVEGSIMRVASYLSGVQEVRVTDVAPNRKERQK